MTVKELIEYLEKYSFDKTVVINDADTNWYLNISKVSRDENKEVIVISGYYGNEYNEKRHD